jgi:hypothetical protein
MQATMDVMKVCIMLCLWWQCHYFEISFQMQQ